jgi:hypothetical protein
LLVVAFESIYSRPPPPVRYAPLVVISWFALGIGLLLLYRKLGREESVLEAGSKIVQLFEHSVHTPGKSHKDLLS